MPQPDWSDDYVAVDFADRKKPAGLLRWAPAAVAAALATVAAALVLGVTHLLLR